MEWECIHLRLIFRTSHFDKFDSDIIFHVMKKLYKKDNFNKVVLVSGDGDYRMLVDFLIAENRFEKILRSFGGS